MRQFSPVKNTLSLVFLSLLFNAIPFLAGDIPPVNPNELEFTGTITFEHVKDAGGTFAAQNAQFYTSENQEHVLVVDGESFGTRSANNKAYSYTEGNIEDQNDFETKLRLSFSGSETFDVSSTNSIYVFNNGNAAVFSFVSNTGPMADLASIPAQSGMTISLSDNNTAISYIDISTNNNFSIYISSLAVENVTASNAPSLTVGDDEVTFSQGDDPVQISPTGTVSLADETMWVGGGLSAQISTNAEPGDSLIISDDDEDDISISTLNMDLLANDVVVGSLNMANGRAGGNDLLSVDFNENATNTILQEVLQSIRFEEAYGFISEELREITIVARNNGGLEIKKVKQSRLINYPTFSGCTVNQAQCDTFNPTRPSDNNIVNINGATQLEFSDLAGATDYPEGSYYKVQKINGELLINGQPVVKDQNDSISSTDQVIFTPNREDGQYNIIYATLFVPISASTYFELPTPQRVIGDVRSEVLSPTFMHAGNQTVDQNAGATTILNFITSFDDGNLYLNDEVQFSITENDNPSLFSSAPEISNSGILTFTPNSNAYGIANLTISLYNDYREKSTQDNVTVYITPNDLLINEIYPKASAEFEFLEIINQSDEAKDLSDLVLVLFNGANDLAYKDIGLDGSLSGNDFFVIGGDQVPNLDLDWGSTSFQNGPDAVALYVGSTSDFNTGSAPGLDGLVDVIVYGDTDDEDLRAALGNTNLQEPGDDRNSLSRRVANSSVFVVQPDTPGEANLDLGITLSIAGLTGVDKVYDGNTLAEASGTAELLGIEEGDDVYLTGTPEFNFNAPDAASDVDILVTGYVLEGDNVDKYTLALPTLTGSITPKELTITGISGDDKVYDGSTEATVSGTAELSGVETNDDVTLAGEPVHAFSNVNASENITIISSGYSISGTDAGNYTITQPLGLTADITPKPLSVSLQVDYKIYDGDVSASVSSANLNTDEEVFGDDDVSIGETPSAYAFEDSNAGSEKAVTIIAGEFKLRGDDAGNYMVIQPENLSADIIPKALTLTVTVNDKVYDGGVSTTVDQTTLEGLIEGDLVTVVGPSTLDFEGANVGTNKPIITEELFSLAGDAAANYFIDDSQSTGDILPKELAIIGLTGDDKTYNGNAAATASGTASLSGVVETDEVILGGSPAFTFASSNVANSITIGVSGYTISGAESGNYELTQPTLSADITAKVLTVSVTANNKTYDKTTAATVGSASLVGIENGDLVSINTSPSAFAFANDNVGTGIAVSATGNYTLTGADAGNYSITQPSGLTADITAKALTVNVTANNKTYDKSTTATVGETSLEGVIQGDDVELSGSPEFAFESEDVGTGIAITASDNYSITGDEAANYTLTQPTGLTADITAKTLKVNVAVNNKSYDKTITATVGEASLEGVVDGDAVELSGSPDFAFENANVGADINVTTSGNYSITGDAASNYTLAQPIGLTADITAKALTVNVTANNKTYDKTTTATVGEASLEGVIDGDAVELSNSLEFTFATEDVGTDIAVSATGNYTLAGTDASNYTVTQPTGLTADIIAKALTVNATANSKIYDKTTTATVGSVSLVGIESGDEVTIDDNPSAFIFASDNVGTDIAISVTGNYTLTGTDAGNYTITQPIGLTADITPKPLSVSLQVDYKIYDGNVSASVSSANLNTDEEVFGDDDVSLGETPSAYAFEDSNAGSEKAVTVVAGEFKLSGDDAGNYMVIQPENLSADIIPKALTLTVTVNDKVYDGGVSTTVDQTTLEGLIEGDLVTVVGPSTLDFEGANVGTNKPIITEELFSLAGDAAPNYFIDDSQSTGHILPKELAIIGLTGDDKTYNGNAAATASGTASLSGIVGTDEVILGGSPAFTFTSPNVANSITIGVSGYTISGAESRNYELNQPTLSGDITPKALTISGITGNDKEYDGNTLATVNGSATLIGTIIGDAVELSNSPEFTFASEDAGTDIAVSATGNYTLTGTDASNYTVTQPTGLTADITAKALTVNITANNKTYDKTTTATVGDASLSGIIEGDAVELSSSPEFAFASEGVGTGIAVSATGNYTLTGTDASNYTVTQPTGLTA
ncbi:beta strand repeat-containing protein, partial [Roseivirga sp.]|uniref:beta strand repeat-containing protein n=1 Tax=Roseivirga sp. TaxID=1964215 RepID=UPI003B8E4ADE